ncbi:vesicular GABA transporter-like [Porites lutea]|uniref:vesicular GABA transporter-like n=1 Tax=Porites lutea TaxID=51062 RepID=UPI003CC619CA
MFLKSYSQIAWLSTISIVAIGLTTALTVWYGVANIENWNLSTLLFWDFEGVFISLGIALSSYGVAEIIPSVEKSMKNKSDFGKALASAFAVSVVIKVIIAVFGFLTFGSKTDEAIVNNFPVGPLNITASISLVISSLLSIILCLRPVCESLDESTFFSEITSDISNTIPSGFLGSHHIGDSYFSATLRAHSSFYGIFSDCIFRVLDSFTGTFEGKVPRTQQTTDLC